MRFGCSSRQTGVAERTVSCMGGSELKVMRAILGAVFVDGKRCVEMKARYGAVSLYSTLLSLPLCVAAHSFVTVWHSLPHASGHTH